MNMAETTEAKAASDLRHQALGAMIRFDIFVAMIIFLSAWSLRFWQGWLFWLVFSALVWWITLFFLKHDPHLIEGRMKAGPRNEQRTTQKIIQALASLLAAALMIVPGLDHHFGWSSVSVPIVLLGDAMRVAGFAIVFRVFRENSFAASTIKVETEQRVIATGPYAMVRHPMYSGASMALLATPLALGSIWGLLIASALIAVIVVRLLDEERYLASNLAAYDSYCRKVRHRLIPMIW
jgi:protein-S-isoprenylcysteine O-methyltransferase Ste14